MANPSPRPPEKDSKPKEETGGLWALAGIGLELTVAMVLSVALGKWLDARFGWSPWGTLCIPMLALAGVLYRIVRSVNK